MTSEIAICKAQPSHKASRFLATTILTGEPMIWPNFAPQCEHFFTDILFLDFIRHSAPGRRLTPELYLACVRAVRNFSMSVRR